MFQTFFIFHSIYGLPSFPLTNSIIFQDGYCTTNQHWVNPSFPPAELPGAQQRAASQGSKEAQVPCLIGNQHEPADPSHFQGGKRRWKPRDAMILMEFPIWMGYEHPEPPSSLIRTWVISIYIRCSQPPTKQLKPDFGSSQTLFISPWYDIFMPISGSIWPLDSG